MATTRLRRTFHYPSDDDDNDAVEEGMDEQDRETIISTLAHRDTKSTTLYTHILLILPLAPLVLYIPRIFSPSTIIPSLAAITSLIASAYTLYFLPLPAEKQEPTPTKAAARKTQAAPDFSIFSSPRESRDVPYLPAHTADLLRRYTIPVNSALCGLLVIIELFQGRSWSEGMMIGGGYVPAFVWTFILWARRELRALDLSDLERLRYTSGAG